jgi:hypothetical protein
MQQADCGAGGNTYNRRKGLVFTDIGAKELLPGLCMKRALD